MIHYSKWLSLPLTTRQKIAEVFGIEKKGPTEVFSNTIKSDGYAIQDIENALSRETMSAYVQRESTDLNALFDFMVDKIEGREVTPLITNTKPNGKTKKARKN